MMASFGKLSNSIISATNENSLSLVNVKADFSLIRCDPAREYVPVSLALTNTRRREAESGSMHATACRLGFLFNEMLPDTPTIIKAYGSRTSEILSRPDISPEGTENDGPFREFIGADCTSIWAAATSGPASISVLLLACMLARAWDTKPAISIWVELVEERRRQIQAQIQDNKIIHPHSVAASRETIGRAELAEWDASARAWLRRADLFMAVNNTQLRLVMNNLAIPFSSVGSTFEKVTLTWIRAMEVGEKLLGNLPQQASDRGVLLALSSWHLYPDLVVFQDKAKKIPFKDKLFPNAGVLSLGLEYKGPSDHVAQWSLALSHLRYYGDPVRVQSRNDLSRVGINQLWLVALGAVFRKWGVSYANFDVAVDWFRDLHNVLSNQHIDQGDTPQLSWVVRLCAAASAVGRDGDASLIKYGWRRGRKILGGDDKTMHSAFFGLCNPHVMAALPMAAEADCGIVYLRGIASQLGLQVHQAVILYTNRQDNDTTYTEWTTIFPIAACLGQWAGDASPEASGGDVKYARWVSLHSAGQHIAESTILEQRCSEIERAGEVCHRITHEKCKPTPWGKAGYGYRWERPPRVFAEAGSLKFIRLQSFRGDQNEPFHLYVASDVHEIRATYYFNQMRHAATATASLQQGRHCLQHKFPPQRVVQYLKLSLNITQRDWSRIVTSDSTNNNRLKRKAPMDEADELMAEENHLAAESGLIRPPENQSWIKDDITGAFSLMTGVCNRLCNWLVPLRILEVAHKLYGQLPGASVSVRLIEQDLSKAKWLPPSLRKMLDDPSSPDSFLGVVETPVQTFLDTMTRAQSFACIIMLESGHLNIDPEQLTEVIALCSEDSIFVTGILLADPSIKTEGTSIRHLVGNIGHPGITLMVSPLEPRIRAVDHNPRLVEHRSYDGNDANKFGGTSMHLSFTTWKMPLEWHNTGEIDQEIFLLESVVAVQDNGKWVADIDVLEIEKNCPDIIDHFRCNEDCTSGMAESYDDVVSIDSWEELLDPPPCTGVLRAKGNWVARLAVTAILSQQGRDSGAVIVGDDRICWRCLRDLYSEPEPHVPERIIF